MNIKNLKTIFPNLLAANITPLLWGQAGIGKTQVVKQIAKDMGYNFVYLTFGAVEDVGDIIGLQDRVYDANGVATATHHLAPDWFPTTPNNIIFIDEINRSPKSVIQAMLPFILDGKLHTHLLPENSHIVLAANPPNDEYVVGDISDKALASRACHLVLEPTVNEFLDFLVDQEGEYSVISFIQDNPEMLEVKEEPYKLDFVKPNRRSVGEFVNNFMKTNPPQEIVFEVVKGIAGNEFASKFVNHLKSLKTKKINGELVLNGYDDELRQRVRTSQLDVLNIATEEITRTIKSKKNITKKQAQNLSAFMRDLPIELGYNFIRQLFMLGLDSVNKTIGEDTELNDMFKNKLDTIKNRK
jgi:hypothetical protein